MTERDLEHLKDVPVPASGKDAKRRALAAALSAFDEEHKNSGGEHQGNIVAFGQTETSKAKRSFRMFLSSRATQALAASVAALVIAAPFAFQHLEALRDARPASDAVTLSDKAGQERKREAAKIEAARAESERRAELSRSAPLDSGGAFKEKAMPPPAPPVDADSSRMGGGTLSFESPQPQMDVSQRNAMGLSVEPEPAPVAGNNPIMPSTVPHDSGAVGRVHPMENFLGGSAAPHTAMRGFGGSGAIQPRQSRNHAYKSAAESRGVLAFDGTERAAPKIEEHRDIFEAKEANPVKQVATDPVSTFSIDVDTASYAFVRRALNGGYLPPKDAVRVEEMINSFHYDYPKPDTADVPFKPTVTIMPSPWNAHNKLVHVAIKGYDLKSAERPKANLVFLIDVSGSMQDSDRLPLVKNAFRLLVDQLRPDDTIGIVTYASGSGILLEPTKVQDKGKILAAIDKLEAGGSTAGAAGIEDAYRLAEANFDKAAVNRIVLATDGDFNVGITNREELKGYIERKRKTGIFLSILGVGSGNHNDALMQALAQNGNGTAAYVDTLNEARKVLVDEASSTLFTIAKDVKVQIEWNPARISEYRLIGYETRGLRREDFNNDGVDAGDIGSGHTVTAIYEVTPAGAPKLADDLRYGATEPAKTAKGDAQSANEIGFLKIRYKKPDAEASDVISLPLTDALAKATMGEVPVEQRFSVAVAAFGQLLKGESYVTGYSYDDVLTLAQLARGDDTYGYRSEFLNLVRLAKSAR
jgi:Ca-activated chloride channel family protein